VENAKETREKMYHRDTEITEEMKNGSLFSVSSVSL